MSMQVPSLLASPGASCPFSSGSSRPFTPNPLSQQSPRARETLKHVFPFALVSHPDLLVGIQVALSEKMHIKRWRDGLIHSGSRQ